MGSAKQKIWEPLVYITIQHKNTLRRKIISPSQGGVQLRLRKWYLYFSELDLGGVNFYLPRKYNFVHRILVDYILQTIVSRLTSIA